MRNFKEFQTNSFLNIEKKVYKASNKRQIKILISGMPNEIMVFSLSKLFKYLIKDEIEKFSSLFKIKLLKEYSPNFTHLITYPLKDKGSTIEAKRTLKYLYALIEGKWILTYRCTFFIFFFHIVFDNRDS